MMYEFQVRALQSRLEELYASRLQQEERIETESCGDDIIDVISILFDDTI